MTINALNKSLAITSSSDGILYSKYPNGNAIGVDPWYWEGLETSLNGLSTITSHGTVAWDAGGFARITYSAQGQTAIQWAIPAGNTAIVVEYEVRKNTGANSSKMLKIPARGAYVSPYSKYSNVTAFGGGYTSNTVRITGYSDHSNGGDTALSIRTTGTNTGTYTRATPTFATVTGVEATYDTTGTVWHKMKLWAKMNSDNTADGEFAVWKDDVLILHMTGVYNCATTTGDGTNAGVSAADLSLYQDRDKVSIGDYANAGGFYEDYKNLKIGFTRPSSLP